MLTLHLYLALACTLQCPLHFAPTCTLHIALSRSLPCSNQLPSLHLPPDQPTLDWLTTLWLHSFQCNCSTGSKSESSDPFIVWAWNIYMTLNKCQRRKSLENRGHFRWHRCPSRRKFSRDWDEFCVRYTGTFETGSNYGLVETARFAFGQFNRGYIGEALSSKPICFSTVTGFPIAFETPFPSQTCKSAPIRHVYIKDIIRFYMEEKYWTSKSHNALSIAKEINQQVLPQWPRSGTFKIRPMVIFPVKSS